MTFLMRYLYSLVILNSTTIKNQKNCDKKEKLSISRSGVTTSGRIAPRCPWNHADCTVHASTNSQLSSPTLQEQKYGQQKVSLVGMREVPHRV